MNKENLVKNVSVENTDFIVLMEYVLKSAKIDVNRYKTPFLKRRIQRRMQINEIFDFIEYLDLLKNDSNELIHLIESLSIHVTSFFRDISVFDSIGKIIVSKMLSNADSDKKIHIWSAGCASGEEPYSIAMLLNDVSKTSKNMEIHIKATDMNDKAIDFAQKGKYSKNMLKTVPDDLKKKYFIKLANNGDSEFEIMPEVKKLINFEVKDISSGHDFKYDVIFCRNVLIYYEKKVQEIILKKFYNCLKDGGYLVLGSDEILIGKGTEDIFNPVMPMQKIFQKINP